MASGLILSLLLHFLVVKDSDSRLSLLGLLVEPHLIDAEFRKAWMLYFLSVWSSSCFC